MTLTLVIGAGERLSNGVPGELVLHRRGAVIGRASTCDWPLPDPTRHISSRHLEVRYDGHGYTLIDTSTNGTFLASSGERLAGAHTINHGDRFKVGSFVIEARLSGDARPAAPTASEPAPTWQGWDAHAPAPPGATPPASDQGPATGVSDGGWSAPPASSGWDASPATPSSSNAGWMPQSAPSLARSEPHRAAAGWDQQPPPARAPQASGWAPDAAVVPSPVPTVSTWDSAAPPRDEASAWSSAARDRPAAASPNDLWGQIAEGNVVDWARGGFGQPAAPAGNPLGLTPPPAAAALPPERPSAPKPAAAPPVTPSPAGDGGIAAFLTAVGIDPATGSPPAAAKAGALFRRLVAGLVVMVEARARAKAQLGAEATAYNPNGHNPLKFARTPDEAIAALLGPARPGFMEPDAAIEDAYRELQQHQIATLRAMQGALRATLERFSPTAIRARANAGGLLERIVPGARDAALWQAYEREFGGVALGSDEAFLDMFAKEFRRAYDEQATSR